MHPLTLDDFEYENYADIFIVKQVPENKNELPLENIRLFLIYFFNKRKLDMYFIKAGAFIIKTNRITCILIFGYTKKYSPLKKSAQIQQLLNSDSDCYIFKNYREFDVYINHTASLYKNPKSSPRNFKTIRGALFCIFEVFTKKEITQSLPAVLPVYTNKIFYLYNWELLRTNKKRELLKGLYQAFYSNLAKDFSAKMGCDTPQLKDFYNNFYNRYINIEYIDELMYRKFFSFDDPHVFRN
jgi:hypothetical protein